jgi:hypothetical protein
VPRSPASSLASVPRVLHARPLTLDFSATTGDLRYIRTPAMELVRRVYFVARDCNWLNLPQHLAPPRVTVNRAGFNVTASGHSRGRGVNLAWRIRITGTSDGTVSFSISGRALADCTTNRAGLCVHLPLEHFSGARYELITGGGSHKKLVLPADVAPHQPCTDIRTMRFHLPHRHRLDLAFAGDAFEIEDQRNWIDGSFKIYSRPLARGFPYVLKAGETFAQSLTLRLLAPAVIGDATPLGSPKRQREGGPARLSFSASSTVTVYVGKELPHPAPALGLGLLRDLAPATARETAVLTGLGLAHVRADFDDFGDGLAARVRRAVAAAAQLGTRLEVAVFSSEKRAARDFAALARALDAAGARVARVLVFGPQGRCANSRAAFAGARRAFGPVCATGTDFNFAELNRGRSRLPAARAFTFAANPQVHASDEQSMAECLEGLRHALTSAHRYFPRATVGVSRLTLRPQKNAVATKPSPDDEARRFDPRQSSAWCAAWTVGALGALQSGGAAWATLYETTGPGGLVTGGRVFPVHRVIADFLACGTAAPLALEISAPLRIAAWARAGQLALANLTSVPVRVAVAGRSLRLPAHGYRCVSLSP